MATLQEINAAHVEEDHTLRRRDTVHKGTVPVRQDRADPPGAARRVAEKPPVGLDNQ